MTIVIISLLAIVFFALWQYSYKRCNGECYKCDSLVTVYAVLILLLLLGLTYTLS